MIVRQHEDREYGDPYWDGKKRPARHVSHTIYAGEIDSTCTMGDCQIESAPNGGYKISIHQEDEFGFERTTEIIFDPVDLELIERMRGLKLI